jgi:hypothetical protein
VTIQNSLPFKVGFNNHQDPAKSQNVSANK